MILPVRSVSAISDTSKLVAAETFIDLSNQQMLVTEQYEFVLSNPRSVLRFGFELLENQSTSILRDVMLSDDSTETELYFIAEQQTPDNLDKIGNFSYKVSVDEAEEMFYVDIFYDFEANEKYILAFNFDQSSLLKISEVGAFIKYPISIPDFVNLADEYKVQFTLPRELMPEDYNMQATTETWFEDITRDNNNLTFSSHNFHYQTGQYIYLSLPGDLFPDLGINQPNLNMADFFPHPDAIAIKKSSILQFVNNPWFLAGFSAISTVIALLIFVVFELEGYLFTRKLNLDESFFKLDSSHAAYMLKSDLNGSVIMSGLLRLVQKNEIELNKTTFTWKYPEREDFSEFNSSEIFLLQWLFDDSGRTRNYSITSAEKIYALSTDENLAEDYLLNFRKYLGLLENDLVDKNYLNPNNKRKGKQAYTIASIILTIIFLPILIIVKSWLSLIMLLPIIFMITRIFKARYFTLDGRERLKQIQTFKFELQADHDFFQDHLPEIPLRDLTPLVLPYIIGFNLLESFLDRIDSESFSRLGILDLLTEQIDFSSMSESILDDEWLLAKTDILRMYYLFEASIVSAQISAQQDLIKKAETDQAS